MLVPHWTRSQSQFNAEQPNEMARRHPSPPDSLSGNNIGRCPAINLNLVLPKESTPMKDVGTTVDKTTSQFNAEQSNEKLRHHPSPPDSLLGNDIGRCPAINLNLILSKESTPTKDVGTTVNKTTIPV